MIAIKISIRIQNDQTKFNKKFINLWKNVWKVDKNSVLSEEEPQSLLKKVPNFLFRSTRSCQKLMLNRLKLPYVCYFRGHRSPTCINKKTGMYTRPFATVIRQIKQVRTNRSGRYFHTLLIHILYLYGRYRTLWFNQDHFWLPR